VELRAPPRMEVSLVSSSPTVPGDRARHRGTPPDDIEERKQEEERFERRTSSRDEMTFILLRRIVGSSTPAGVLCRFEVRPTPRLIAAKPAPGKTGRCAIHAIETAARASSGELRAIPQAIASNCSDTEGAFTGLQRRMED